MQHSDHYLLPSEFLILLSIWLSPPLLVALVVQFFVLRRRLLRWWTFLACFLVTIVASVVAFVAVMATNWKPVSALNRSLSLPPQYDLWFMPVAVVVVAVVSALVGCYMFARAGRLNSSFESRRSTSAAQLQRYVAHE